MARDRLSDKVNDFFRHKKWAEARALLEAELARDPDSHWLLTQLGVTYYEQGNYAEALRLFHASRRIVADCPLTLWHLAGTLDALGKHTAAMRLYTWLLESKTSAADDPCWESGTWADALKADAVYRLGVCFRHLGKKRKAEHCLHQYLNLLSIGKGGMYTLADVMRQIQALNGAGKNGKGAINQREAIRATLQATGLKPAKH